MPVIRAVCWPLKVLIQIPFCISMTNSTAHPAVLHFDVFQKQRIFFGRRWITARHFSHFLIKGLKGQADVDVNKTITIKELFDYVYKNVREYTGNVQSPMIAGDYDEHMPVGFIRKD